MLTAAAVKALPIPTASQWHAFKKHLVNVHSWYKHLPLLEGGQFVVFLAPDAGENYPLEHPKLPTENTLGGYRCAFGHLDYIYQSKHYPWLRDVQQVPQLDKEIFNVGAFKLYPYVSPGIYWSVHENELVQLRDGIEHPDATEILDSYNKTQVMEQCWQNLSTSDRELILSLEDCQIMPINRSLPKPVVRFLELEVSANKAYAKLHEQEVGKLNDHIDAFRQWLIL